MVARTVAVSDRRRVIVEAALRVIARGGADSATHRAVAAEAGVALASTTYHFASKADLVAEALELAIERSIAAVRRHTAAPLPSTPAELVDRLVEIVEALGADEQAPLAAQYELLLEASRRPHLRPLAERWNRAYLDGLETVVAAAGVPEPRHAAEILSDLIDGALLIQLSVPVADFVQVSLRRRLERVVAGLAVATPSVAAAGR
jgi:DNA-binding transcriptional regulator YbjK